MERNSFVFCRVFFEALESLDDDDRLACYDALADYALNGTEPKEGVAFAFVSLAKPLIWEDEDTDGYIS